MFIHSIVCNNHLYFRHHPVESLGECLRMVEDPGHIDQPEAHPQALLHREFRSDAQPSRGGGAGLRHVVFVEGEPEHAVLSYRSGSSTAGLLSRFKTYKLACIRCIIAGNQIVIARVAQHTVNMWIE